MDKLRNQAFPSQRSLKCFHKISQIKIQMKQMGEKQIDKVCEKSENLKTKRRSTRCKTNGT